ncbi:MAG: hypothetical protein FWD69_03730 [Polyangiaceae bacterium]|nr:hypothetical protein [Polyangiaceae bacterium]
MLREAVFSFFRRTAVLSAVGWLLAMPAACNKLEKGSSPTDNVPLAPAEASAIATTQTPGGNGGDDMAGKPPLEQARAYFANGQKWLARLVLEPQALSPSGTPEEAEFLAQICEAQSDPKCIEACNRKLGHKVKADGGTVVNDAGATSLELSRARGLVAKKQFGPARAILEPRVLDGTSSTDEIALLKTICTKQADRMCVAFCDSKLR